MAIAPDARYQSAGELAVAAREAARAAGPAPDGPTPVPADQPSPRADGDAPTAA